MCSRLVRREHRKGSGVLPFLVLLVLAVLSIMLFRQGYLTGVTNQYEMCASGKRAFYLAESAIGEALLDFETTVNLPSHDPGSWFRMARNPGSDGICRKTIEPEVTWRLFEDACETLIRVEVALWHMHPTHSLPYERYGLLTITAVVELPRLLGGMAGLTVRRNVQKSFEFKQVLVTPPRPFDEFTFYLHHWPYLEKQRRGYLDTRSLFDTQVNTLGAALNTEMGEWRDFIQQIIDWCVGAVDEYDRMLDRIRSVSSLEWKFGVKVKGHTLHSEGEAIDFLNGEADRIAREQGFDDRHEVELVSAMAADCWMAAAGYPWTPRAVDWPSFRTDGASLDNPVYVVAPTIRSSDLPIRWPDTPEVPTPLPSDGIPKGAKAFNAWADWAGGLPKLSAAYASWCSRRDSTILPFQHAVDAELRRHEGLFLLVPDSQVETYHDRYEPRQLAAYWKGKASWECENQAELEEILQRQGGALLLDGVYYVKGPVCLDDGPYRGGGAIVSGGGVEVGRLTPQNGETSLTVVAGKDLVLRGDAQAGLLALEGTVRYGGASILGMTSQGHYAGDDFTVTHNSVVSSWERGNDRLERFWLTLSPYPLACNFLRR